VGVFEPCIALPLCSCKHRNHAHTTLFARFEKKSKTQTQTQDLLLLSGRARPSDLPELLAAI
jgi:hypothetical protein